MPVRRLVIAAIAAISLASAALAVRRELRETFDPDTRPCPECQVPAYANGAALTDEQGHRLRFATPELAARYAADYAKP